MNQKIVRDEIKMDNILKISRFFRLRYPAVPKDVLEDMAIGTFTEEVRDMELQQHLKLFEICVKNIGAIALEFENIK